MCCILALRCNGKRVIWRNHLYSLRWLGRISSRVGHEVSSPHCSSVIGLAELAAAGTHCLSARHIAHAMPKIPVRSPVSVCRGRR